MRIFAHVNQLQIFFLGSLLFFTIFLISEVVDRSSGRVSLLSRNLGSRSSYAGVVNISPYPIESSRVRLQDFHRVEYKNGRQIWEISAQEAKHYDYNGISHVNNSDVTIYRPNLVPINLHSNAAKLFGQGDQMSKAELEGEVDLLIKGEVEIKSGRAIYDLQNQAINGFGEVYVNGTGYELSAVGFEMDVATGKIRLLSNVKSKFFNGAEWPHELIGKSIQ